MTTPTKIEATRIIPTPMERVAGRLMRAPDHPGTDGGTGGEADANQSSQQNNQGGNSNDSSTTGDAQQNNTGQDERIAGFWNDPQPEGDQGNESRARRGSGESGQGDDQQQGSQFGNQLVERLNGLKFDDVFTPEVADQIADNNLTGANERFTSFGREAIRQSVIMSAQVMQAAGNQIISRVEGMIQDALGGRDNDKTLLDAFPSAADPRVRPMIQGVFNQSLKHTKGDRAAAIELTRSMLKVVGQGASKDFGFETPPGDREDSFGEGPNALVQELLARN